MREKRKLTFQTSYGSSIKGGLTRYTGIRMQMLAVCLIAAGLISSVTCGKVRAAQEMPVTVDMQGTSKRPLIGRLTETGVSGENTKEKDGAKEEEKEEKKGREGFQPAGNYKQLLDLMCADNNYFEWDKNQYFMTDSVDGVGGGVMNDAAAQPGMPGETEVSKNDYSDTNAQVEGIAEADIVKTDGEYIYILSKGEGDTRIYIVRAKDGALTLESSFCPEAAFNIWQEEMYVVGNRLAVVRCGAKQSGEDEYLDFWFGYHGERKTEILVYDITDRKAPTLLGSHVQDGDYISSREKDGYLYVVSEKGIYDNYLRYIDGGKITDKTDTDGEEEEKLSKEDFEKLPSLDGRLLSAGRIYFCEDDLNSVFTIVSSVRLQTPEDIADSISFMAGSGHCYMSGNAIYLADYGWYDGGENSDYTDIVKITYGDGKLELAAQGRVRGSLDDQFSMDEKDGYLRVVTTVEEYESVREGDSIWGRYLGRSNALYVLDEELKVIGSLENLAEDERIYSARFIGDIAYFVTFRNMDPLFCVDVSDTAHPVLLGELKIPGFSDYLHPYGENLLLGIGYDTDDTGAVECVKLTMFDISNPLGVEEKHTLVLEDYNSSEACYNHRAVLVDVEKNLIGLPFEGSYYGKGGYQDYTQKKGYAVYGYDGEKGFYQKFEKEYVRKWEPIYYHIDGNRISVDGVQKEIGNNWNDWYYMNLRGIYIGDYFYLVNQIKEVCSYRMGQDGFSESDKIMLR